MKNHSFPRLTTISHLFFFLLMSTPILAQKTGGTPTNVSEKQSGATTPPYCDQVANYYGPELQKRANQECRTVFPCIDCVDRASNKKTCFQTVVQPNKEAKCAVQVTDVVDSKNSRPSELPLDQNDFALSIIQSPCYFGGISLQVLANRMNSTLADSPGAFNYSWVVDEMAIGKSNHIDCVSGKAATVKVTQIATGRTKSLTVAISNGVNDIEDKQAPPNAASKLVAVYQKTSCFGTCPSYKVEFFRDGTVYWNGGSNISPLGQKRSKVSSEAFAKIEEKARAIHFLDLNDSYPEDEIVDASATIIYLNLDGRNKQVKEIFGGPAGLTELEKMFDQLIYKLGWARIKAAPVKKTVQAPGKDKKASEN